MRDLQSVVADLLRLMAARNTHQLATVAAELMLIVGAEGDPTEEEYAVLANLLQAPEVIASDRSHEIYVQVQYLWDEFTPKQRRDLTELLEKLYPALIDWVAQLVITDVLGQCSDPEMGLASLRRLRKTQAEIPRALVANGFGQLAKYCPSATVAGQALKELLTMLDDPSGRVQGEARDVLQSLRALVASMPNHALTAAMKLVKLA